MDYEKKVSGAEYIRPHPGPLPQERGNWRQARGKGEALGFGLWVKKYEEKGSDNDERADPAVAGARFKSGDPATAGPHSKTGAARTE